MREAQEVRVRASVAARGLELDVTVPAGETLAVVGPNGAGKSSLVQLVAGGLLPDAGTVTLGEGVLAGPRGHVPTHRRRVAHVEQRSLLFPHLSVLDNVAFGPRSAGATAAAARSRAETELAAVGCAELAQRRPAHLSGGQAQRVALARALAIDPAVVLLDEPFAALDAAVTPELRRVLRDRLRGITTVLVTHDFLDVVALATRVVELGDGKVVAAGAVDDLCQRPTSAFLAGFVGVNLMHGTAHDGALRLADGSLLAGVGDRLPAGPARAVFQPSAVSLFATAPHGSPRNELPAVVVRVEDRWPVQRVVLEVAGQQLAADLTPESVRELGLAPGDRVVAVIKATQVALHPS